MAKRVQVLGTIFANKGENPNVDFEYGPYTSLEAAEQSLGSPDELPSGFTIGIGTYDGELKEYWLQPVDGVKQWVEKGAAASPSDPGNANIIAGENISVEQTSNGTKVSAKVPEVPIKEIQVGGEKVEPKNGVVNIPKSEGAKVDNTDLSTETTDDTTTAPSREAVREALDKKLSGIKVENGTAKINADGTVTISFEPVGVDDTSLSDDDLTSNDGKNNAPSRRAVQEALNKKGSGGGNGTVTSVNGVSPTNGNVQLEIPSTEEISEALEQVETTKAAMSNLQTSYSDAITQAREAAMAAWYVPIIDSTSSNVDQTTKAPKDSFSSYSYSYKDSAGTVHSADSVRVYKGMLCTVKTTEGTVVSYKDYKCLYTYTDDSGNLMAHWIELEQSMSTENVNVTLSTNHNNDVEVPTDGTITVSAYNSTTNTEIESKKWEGAPLTFSINGGIGYYFKVVSTSDGSIKDFLAPISSAYLAGSEASGNRNVNLIFRATKITVALSSDDPALTQDVLAENAFIFASTKAERYVNGGKILFIPANNDLFTVSTTNITVGGNVYRTSNYHSEKVSDGKDVTLNIEYTKKTSSVTVGILWNDKTITNVANVGAADSLKSRKQDAIGIYFETANQRTVIALPSACTVDSNENEQYWSVPKFENYNPHYPSFMSNRTVSSDEAKSEFYGFYNTKAWFNLITTNGIVNQTILTGYPAFKSCYNTKMTNGDNKNNYIGNGGEMVEIMQNASNIATCLYALGFYPLVDGSRATNFPTSGYMATSSVNATVGQFWYVSNKAISQSNSTCWVIPLRRYEDIE